MNAPLIFLLISLALPLTVPAATFTVINTNDSGAGSLRQAILDNNAASITSTNLIQFNIGGAGVRTIAPITQLPSITRPVVIDGFTQPGATSNTLTIGINAALKIRIDGSLVTPGAHGLDINASNTTVRGLVIVNFPATNAASALWITGARFVVEGCYLGLEADGTTTAGNGYGIYAFPVLDTGGSRIGGSTPSARNVISANISYGVVISSAHGMTVQGNLFGTDASGTLPRGNGFSGLFAIYSSFNLIGGTNALQRNVFSGNGIGLGYGLAFLECYSNSVLGNYIGVNAAGTAALPNTYIGLDFHDCGWNIIGAPGAGNVISANPQWQVMVRGIAPGQVIQGNRIGPSADGFTSYSTQASGLGLFGAPDTVVGGPNPGEGNQFSGNIVGLDIYDAPGTRVQGNLIGTDANGTGPLGNPYGGMIVATPCLVGGTNAADANIIAFNSYGVGVGGVANRSSILRNSIHSNTELGIILFVNGGPPVTPNDPGDLDTGPNGLQNFPVLAFAYPTPTNSVVSGLLNSQPNRTYRLDFYSNPTCDPSGYGQGKTWLGTTNVATDPNGDSAFTIRFVGSLSGYITSTATDPDGNTSGFSACVQLLPFSPDVAISIHDSADPVGGGAALSYFVEVTNRGPADATGVVLTNFLPATVNFVSATSSQGSCVLTGGVVTCDLGALAANSSATVTIDVTTTVLGSVTNRAVVHATELDNDFSNNSAVEITAVGFMPDLAVTIRDSVDPVGVGAAFSYVVQVTNRGTALATGVVLTNTLPPEVSFVSATSSQGSCTVAGGIVTCDLGSLAASGGATVTLNVTAPAATAGYAFAYAEVRANETEDDLSNNSDYEITYLGFTDLVVTRTLSTNFIVAGQPFTILLTASNAGPGLATSVYLYYSLDSSLTVVSAELSQGSFEEQISNYALLGTIAVGASATLTLHVIPTDYGTVYEYGYAYGAEYDSNSGDNNLYGSYVIHEGPGVFEFSDARFNVREDGGTATISVTRLGGALGTASVNYATADLTATAGSDYDAASGTLVFTNGETAKTFAVPVHEDVFSECNESVRLMLFNPAGGAVLARHTNATLWVFDNDVSFVGAVEVLSLDTNTPPHVGDDYSYEAVISANGAFVAFASYAQTLVTNDHNGDVADVFLRDVANRTTQLISVNTNGVSANDDSGDPRISENGRFVAFGSSATDLAVTDTDVYWNIFLRDTLAGTTVLVSVNTNGTSSGESSSYSPQMTPDGRFIVFNGKSRNLVTNEMNGYRYNIFLRDMSNSVLELISVNTNGSSANGASTGPTVSDDGRFVAFLSGATDLNAAVLNHVPGGSDDYGKDDIYVRDRLNGTNILCSVATNGTGGNVGVVHYPGVSANGQVVVFSSEASDLAPGDTNGVQDIFAFDVPSRTLHLVSVNAAGTGSGNARSTAPVVSANGRYVVFESYASDLVAGGGGQVHDLFVRDLVAGTTMLVSANCSGTGGGNDESDSASISRDGRFVTFESYASDLAPGDFTEGRRNIFRRDLLTGTTFLISFDPNLNGPGNDGSYYPAISADGGSIAFESDASNLVANDDNDTGDIFLWRAAAGPSGTNASIAALRMTGGQPTLTVNGSPGTLYLLQRATSLTPPVSWTAIGTTNAPTSGQFKFIDPAPLPGSAFYRVARP